MIKAKNIFKDFGKVEVLKGIDLEIEKSEVVAIVGPSGSGKTTLLQILSTLEKPCKDRGCQIEINGIHTEDLSSKKLAKFRNQQIGFVFQFHQLLPEFTALENVCIPAFIQNNSKKADIDKKALELLDYLGLKNRLYHKPNQLSGGEQQRVSVARALINNPAVVFADEPSGNLDSKSANHLHNLFLKLRDDFQQTFVIVTHNESFADMANRKITIKDGLLV